MAGHSKWANIQHRKGAQDKKRNQLFSKICREVTIAAKVGGGNPDNNPRLKNAIALAKKNSVPNKNIDNAVKKGTGEIAGENYEETTFEGYGVNGIAVFVEASTDNRNRTVSDVRAAFTKTGGQLGESGSVNWMFDRKGEITVMASHYPSEEDLFEIVVEAGGEDMKRDDDKYVITTEFESLFEVKQQMEEAGVVIEEADVTRVPQNMTEVEDLDTAVKILKLIDRLEDLDDVMKVYANFDISDDLMEQAAEKI